MIEMDSEATTVFRVVVLLAVEVVDDFLYRQRRVVVKVRIAVSQIAKLRNSEASYIFKAAGRGCRPCIDVYGQGTET